MNYLFWLLGFYSGTVFTNLLNLLVYFNRDNLIGFTFYNLIVLICMLIIYSGSDTKWKH